MENISTIIESSLGHHCSRVLAFHLLFHLRNIHFLLFYKKVHLPALGHWLAQVLVGKTIYHLAIGGEVCWLSGTELLSSTWTRLTSSSFQECPRVWTFSSVWSHNNRGEDIFADPGDQQTAGCPPNQWKAPSAKLTGSTSLLSVFLSPTPAPAFFLPGQSVLLPPASS